MTGWNVSELAEDSLDLGPDDRPIICENCHEEEVEGVCACRCRGCGQPCKSGWCDNCDQTEPSE